VQRETRNEKKRGGAKKDGTNNVRDCLSSRLHLRDQSKRTKRRNSTVIRGLGPHKEKLKEDAKGRQERERSRKKPKGLRRTKHLWGGKGEGQKKLWKKD